MYLVAGSQGSQSRICNASGYEYFSSGMNMSWSWRMWRHTSCCNPSRARYSTAISLTRIVGLDGQGSTVASFIGIAARFKRNLQCLRSPSSGWKAFDPLARFRFVCAVCFSGFGNRDSPSASRYLIDVLDHGPRIRSVSGFITPKPPRPLIRISQQIAGPSSLGRRLPNDSGALRQKAFPEESMS